MREDEYSETCSVCTEWERDLDTVYGQCKDLHILTEEEFYCDHFEDKRPPEDEETALDRELENNPNF